MTEEIYQNIVRSVDSSAPESVHLAKYPVADESLIDDRTEERMDLVKVLVNLGRSTREQEKLKVRQPLSKVIVDGNYREMIDDLTDLIKEELNVHEVQFEDELDKYMEFSIKPNFRAAGPVLGKKVKDFGANLAKINAKEMIAALTDGPVMMTLGDEEYEITEDLVDVRISSKEGFVVGMDNNVFVILDTTLTPELIRQGYVREVISKIQQLRKQADFEMMDEIRIFMKADDEIKAAVEEARDYIMDETIAVNIFEKEDLPLFDINGHKTGLAVEKI